MKRFVFSALIASIFLLSCQKDSTEDLTQDEVVNSWTFTVQGTIYKGELDSDPVLNTLLQGNETYTFEIVGGEQNTDRILNIVLSLADTTFTQKNYQSGVSGNAGIDSFAFSHRLANEYIYRSANQSPGPILNYKVESYNASSNILVLSFSGTVQDSTGNLLPLTAGKVTCKVQKARNTENAITGVIYLFDNDPKVNVIGGKPGYSGDPTGSFFGQTIWNDTKDFVFVTQNVTGPDSSVLNSLAGTIALDGEILPGFYSTRSAENSIYAVTVHYNGKYYNVNNNVNNATEFNLTINSVENGLVNGEFSAKLLEFRLNVGYDTTTIHTVSNGKIINAKIY